MNFGFLLILFIVLLLLLTGSFIPITVFAIKILGWILLLVIGFLLLWKTVSMLLRPVTQEISRHHDIRELEEKIKFKRKFGYDTPEYEQKVNELKNYDIEDEKMRIKRKSLGYKD